MTLPKYPTSAEYVREINKCCEMAYRFALRAGAPNAFIDEFAFAKRSGGVNVYKDVYAGTVISVQENAARARRNARRAAEYARKARRVRCQAHIDGAVCYALYCADIAGYVAAQDRGYKAEIAAMYN